MAERPGIIGLETEHVVLYLADEDPAPPPEGIPGVASGALRSGAPSFQLLESILFECLLEGRKAAVSSDLKKGYFLENGGLVHMELSFQHQADTPILEMSTPECRTPWDLLAYSRAYDEVLEETSRRSRAAFCRYGYRGRIAFGKNNQDTHGVGFGCHENYLIHGRHTHTDRLLKVLALPIVLLCYLPVVIIIAVVFAVFLAAVGVAIVWEICARALPALDGLPRRLLRWFRQRAPRLETWLYKGIFVVTTALLYPSMLLYSRVVRHIACGRFISGLTPFLVTRQIITGAGALNFRRSAYEVSQRANLTRSLAEIVMFGKRKTVFDLKGFLFNRSGYFVPLTLRTFLSPLRKLSLAVGDSNLSDVPNLLKTGAGVLLIEMIEAGVRFDDLRLARPMRALKAVSEEGPWKKLPLRSGKSLTALEVQRQYLDRATAFFKDRPPGAARHDEILELWEECLDKLAERPQALAGLVDWVTKKQILDRAVLPVTNWRVFFAWGRLFELAGLETAASADSFHDLILRSTPVRRWRARRLARKLGLDISEYRAQRDVHFQARKIDLRYHELGGGTSYQRALEAEGLIRRLATDDAIARAVREPPPDTRARVRGHYIQKSFRTDLLQVNWSQIELLSPVRHIPTPDPFESRIPSE